MVRSIEGTVYRITTYQGTAMRKHGGDRMQLQDVTLKHLDALAHVRVAPMGVHGLVVRRAAGGEMIAHNVTWRSGLLDRHHEMCGPLCQVYRELHNDLLGTMLAAGL